MGLLSGEEIQKRRAEIFRGGTFSSNSLRPAAYDLRVELAEDEATATTGTIADETLILEKGQRAALRTFEVLAMPWDVAGNVGVKHRKAVRGLFISPGLFVDPGFGWRSGTDGEGPIPEGRRLRFLVTNIGHGKIAIRLGAEGDKVVGLQLFDVAPPTKKEPASHPDISDAHGMAVFEDLLDVQQAVKAGLEDLETRVHRTEVSTERVVVFGVFLVSATLFGALMAYVLTLVSSDNLATKTVRAMNELDTTKPWSVALVIALLLLTVVGIAGCAAAVVKTVTSLRQERSTPQSSPDVSAGGAGTHSTSG
jgi:hypothetical protein